MAYDPFDMDVPMESLVKERPQLAHIDGDGPAYTGIRFCGGCNNMLYPREDKEARKLTYACRSCDFVEDSDDPCIYVHRLSEKKIVFMPSTVNKSK